MFRIEKGLLGIENPILVSRPPEKFFNVGEHPDFGFDPVEHWSDVAHIWEKADGSLLSTFLHNGEVRFKSKTSVNSDHAKAANEWLKNQDPDLKKVLLALERSGYTVNMEWCSPDPKFRVVVAYPFEGAVFLNARHRFTGDYQSSKLDNILFGKLCRMVDDNMGRWHCDEYMSHMENLRNAEGYVVQHTDGRRVKHKCEWYLERHRCLDTVRNPRAYAELVLKQENDDVKQFMSHMKDELEDIEQKVTRLVNRTIKTVTGYFQDNQDLSRKDYAIKAKDVLSPLEFHFAMSYYGGTEPDWYGHFLKKVKTIEWGFENDL